MNNHNENHNFLKERSNKMLKRLLQIEKMNPYGTHTDIVFDLIKVSHI